MGAKKETIDIRTVRNAIARYQWRDSFTQRDECRLEAIERMKDMLKVYCTEMAKASHGKRVDKEKFLQGFKHLLAADKSNKKENVLLVLALNDFYIMAARDFSWSHTHTRDGFWEHFASEEAKRHASG